MQIILYCIFGLFCCSDIIKASFTNETVISDSELKIKTKSKKNNDLFHDWIKSFILPGGRSNFIIDNRYPDGGEGEKPTIILRKGKEIEFNVSSFDELTSCLWRGPFSRTKTCQITE